MPCAAGSVSQGTSGRNSAKQLGQPLVKISGIPRPQVSQDLVTDADAELLRPQGSHPASLARRQRHQAPAGCPAARARPRLTPGPQHLTLSAAPMRAIVVKRAYEPGPVATRAAG